MKKFDSAFNIVCLEDFLMKEMGGWVIDFLGGFIKVKKWKEKKYIKHAASTIYLVV